MKLTLLCNAGLALESQGHILLVDLPNHALEPFCGLPEDTWQQIYDRRPPYDRVCGLWFTHDHPDHCHRERVQAYHERWPMVPIFLPDLFPASGTVRMNPFVLQYSRMDHAPIPNPPIHVVTVVKAGEKSLYLSGDAVLDRDAHLQVLNGRRCSGAVWNPMYLSRPDTRLLLQEAADRNFICHMPAQRPDPAGYWKKLERNLEQFGAELTSVTVLDRYPMSVTI